MLGTNMMSAPRTYDGRNGQTEKKSLFAAATMDGPFALDITLSFFVPNSKLA